MSIQERLQISNIGQVAIPVHQLERAVAFYRDVLGMTFLFQTPSLAFFQCGEVRLMLSIPEGPGASHHASVLYYQVEDIHSAFQLLRGRSVKIIDEPHLIAKMADHDLWMTFFEDTEGNILGLMCEVRNA